MSVICFVTYEIHPTTWGGCGVLLHHAAERLLVAGHTVIFLLDIAAGPFKRFKDQDRLAFTNAANCRAYQVDELCADFPYTPEDVPEEAVWKALRFGHACQKLVQTEPLDFIEFVEYCGIGYYAMVHRLFSETADGAILGERLHNSIELIDLHGATRCLDRGRYLLYGLERSALDLSEAVLAPTQTYYDRYYRDAYRLPPQRVAISQSPKLDFPRVSRRPDPKGEFTIAHLGRLFQFKGVYQLVLAAVALMKARAVLRFKVDLIGSDSPESPFGASYIEYLKTLIPADLQDRFLFAGHLQHADVARRLDRALFGVFPNRFESFCYAAHEVYDAGVPLIVNDLPGWADFFKHGENALVYDGTTQGLLQAMQQMIDDTGLRERITRPYPIADNPLGDFYARPRRLSSIVSESNSEPGKAVLVVLCPAGAAPGATTAARALSAQRYSNLEKLFFSEPSNGQEPAIWWLGKAWYVSDVEGRPVPLTAMLTGDALGILRHSDCPGPDWLRRCMRALGRRPQLAFAGTWARRGGKLLPLYFDLAPEYYPFEHGSTPTRALIRTRPNRLLVDLLDPNLGSLGEIGYLWQVSVECGRGCLLPEPMLEVADEPDGPLDMNLLHYLLARYGGPFEDRFTILAGILKDKLVMLDPTAGTRSEVPRMVSVEEKLKLADELGGSDLLRMGFRKLARRLGLPI